MDATLEKVVEYMKTHWPSKVEAKWQVEMAEYPEILKRVMKDFTVGASKGREFIRIAGLSGSGKTTQILPAVEAYSEKKKMKPILVAARRFVEYHPHYREILEFYGEANVRKMTDEFSTIMMFMTLMTLMREGYDIALDVTLLDPAMEEILIEMLRAGGYTAMLLMIAVSPVVTEHFLAGREWRHTRETEEEFLRATGKALEYYAEKMGEMRVIMWSVYGTTPVYDGEVKGALEIYNIYSARTELPRKDNDARREAKKQYLCGIL